MTGVLAARLAQQQALTAIARGYASTLAARLPVRAVLLVGSVARGDFNQWSDIDVLVIADDLPGRWRDRQALLDVDAPPGVQPVGITSAELRRPAARRNRLLVDAAAHARLLVGDADAVSGLLAAVGQAGTAEAGNP